MIEVPVEYLADRKEIQPERAWRAWVLAKEEAAKHDLEIKDALRQRDQL